MTTIMTRTMRVSGGLGHDGEEAGGVGEGVFEVCTAEDFLAELGGALSGGDDGGVFPRAVGGPGGD
jgi:hypothetical protein